jgi:hypothetical protein
MKQSHLALVILWAGLNITAHAADINFFNDPFAGSTALTTPGRQVNGLGEQTLPTFDIFTDRFVFNPNAFSNISSINFISSLGADLPDAGANVIVLQNSTAPFNAGLAATLIANQLTTDGAGFFVYFNTTLNVSRLVYSTHLNVADADLAILARITSATGQGAIDNLSRFSEANFGTSDVPEASSSLLCAAGLAMVYLRVYKR